jgi:outer membrane biosynthesis protein TonB
MQNASMKRSAVLVAGALGLSGAFFAGAAFAADPKLDEATGLITKAVAALKAAQNPDQKKEFGGHRMAAIELLMRAQGEIIKAKQFADAAPPTQKEPQTPTPKQPKPPTQKEPQTPTQKEPQTPTPKG